MIPQPGQKFWAIDQAGQQRLYQMADQLDLGQPVYAIEPVWPPGLARLLVSASWFRDRTIQLVQEPTEINQNQTDERKE